MGASVGDDDADGDCGTAAVGGLACPADKLDLGDMEACNIETALAGLVAAVGEFAPVSDSTSDPSKAGGFHEPVMSNPGDPGGSGVVATFSAVSTRFSRSSSSAAWLLTVLLASTPPPTTPRAREPDSRATSTGDDGDESKRGDVDAMGSPREVEYSREDAFGVLSGVAMASNSDRGEAGAGALSEALLPYRGTFGGDNGANNASLPVADLRCGHRALLRPQPPKMLHAVTSRIGLLRNFQRWALGVAFSVV